MSIRQTSWWRRWARYGACPYCAAPEAEPCVDTRWDGRHPRWCRHPHPERRHARLAPWEFDVAVSTHARLRRGEVTGDWRRVEVLAATYLEASDLAYALAAAPDGAVVTDLLWRC